MRTTWFIVGIRARGRRFAQYHGLWAADAADARRIARLGLAPGESIVSVERGHR